jgi:hypothetical protein
MKNLGENRLIFLVRALEVGDLVVSLEVPNPGRDFINQIVVMRD